MKLGIIGSGKIVHDFLSIADQIPNLELAALSTTKRSHQIGLELQEKYNISKLYQDNTDLFNDANVDTVYVAVPNSLHFSIAKAALEAGKNVICEKPFVTTTDEARELKEIADKNQVIIVEAITNIYLENFKFIEDNLAKIAPIHVVNLNYTQYSSRYDAFLEGDIQPAFDPKKDGGALMDLGIYNLHIIIKLFGKPDSVKYFPTIQKILILLASFTWAILTNKPVQLQLKIAFHLMSAPLKVKKVHSLFTAILMKCQKLASNYEEKSQKLLTTTSILIE